MTSTISWRRRPGQAQAPVESSCRDLEGSAGNPAPESLKGFLEQLQEQVRDQLQGVPGMTLKRASIALREIESILAEMRAPIEDDDRPIYPRVVRIAILLAKDGLL
jgi:hypothetical protein